MNKDKSELEDDGWCFACGIHNPNSLHLMFKTEGEYLTTTFKPNRTHQGYKGILHGGIICTLLDEVMAWSAIEYGKPAVTARLEVRYLKPASTDGTLEARARVVVEKKRLIKVEAELYEIGVGCVAKAKADLLPL
ncbi:MAG: PaaI family thioesterase [bacterium]|jgi:uncharacterized protein (TIGR00369 family)|nr:PaaI family thioesterase [bacterium]